MRGGHNAPKQHNLHPAPVLRPTHRRDKKATLSGGLNTLGNKAQFPDNAGHDLAGGSLR